MRKVLFIALLFPAMSIAGDTFINVNVKVNKKEVNLPQNLDEFVGGTILAKANGTIIVNDDTIWLKTRSEVVRVKANWIVRLKKLKSYHEQEVVVQGFIGMDRGEKPHIVISPLDIDLK